MASPPTAPRNNVGWATATTTLIDRHRRPNVDQSERVQQQVEDPATMFLGAAGSREAAGRLQNRREESPQQRVLFVHSVAKLPQCLQCLRLRAVEAAWHCRLQPLPDLRQLLLHRHTIHYPPLPLLRQQILPLSQTKEGCVSTSRRTAAAQARENHKREPRVSPQHSIGSVAVRCIVGRQTAQ